MNEVNDPKIDVLSAQIGHQIKFMDSMEKIRWRFTSAFGITAIITMSFISTKSGTTGYSEITQILAYLITAFISISGIITQVRIGGLFWGTWKRILILQKEMFKISQEKYEYSENIKRSWTFPEIEAPVKSGKYFLTVHGVNCLIFSVLLAASLTLIFELYITSPLLYYIVFFFITLLISTLYSMHASILFFKSCFESTR